MFVFLYKSINVCNYFMLYFVNIVCTLPSMLFFKNTDLMKSLTLKKSLRLFIVRSQDKVHALDPCLQSPL